MLNRHDSTRGTVSFLLMRESTHCGRGALRPIASGTDCFDDIRYSVPVACCFGPKSTKVKPCWDCAVTTVTNTTS